MESFCDAKLKCTKRHPNQYINNLASSSKNTYECSSYTYTRSQLLELRCLPVCQVEPDEKILFRNSRLYPKLFKPDTKPHQRNIGEPESNGIVLGPQKRSWNIGCHVAEPRRALNETTSSAPTHRNFQDKHVVKKSDPTRETDGIDGASRNFRKKDKSFIRTTSDNSFSRSYCQAKSNSVSKVCNKFTVDQKQPEWFSDGPETVKETIDLGEIAKESEDRTLHVAGKDVNSPLNSSTDASSETVTENVLHLNANPDDVMIAKESPGEIFDLEFLKILEKPKSEESRSHFRHLFTQSESGDSSAFSNKRTDNSASSNYPGELNPELVNFLSFSHKDVLASDRKFVEETRAAKSHATDLENALRSILLVNGQDNVPSKVNSKSSSEFSSIHLSQTDPAVLSSRNAYNSNFHSKSVQSPNNVPMFKNDEVRQSSTKETFDLITDDVYSKSNFLNKQQHFWDDALVSVSLTPETDITRTGTEAATSIRVGPQQVSLSPSSLKFFSTQNEVHEAHSSRRPIVKSLSKTEDSVCQPFLQNLQSAFDSTSRNLQKSDGSALLSCNSRNSKQFPPEMFQSTAAFSKSDFSIPPPYYPFYSPPIAGDGTRSLQLNQQDSQVSKDYASTFVPKLSVSGSLSSMNSRDQSNVEIFYDLSSNYSTSSIFKSAAFQGV